MTDKQTPAIWILREAWKRFGYTGETKAENLRAYYQMNNHPGFRALCDMIEKHEQPPVDRKLLCAREAALEQSSWVRDTTQHGRYDNHHHVVLGARAIELWEEGFGK